MACQNAGGPVAQWLEQATHNRSVVGSIPARPTRSDHECRGRLGNADRFEPGCPPSWWRTGRYRCDCPVVGVHASGRGRMAACPDRYSSTRP